jgi:hypothetical protein
LKTDAAVGKAASRSLLPHVLRKKQDEEKRVSAAATVAATVGPAPPPRAAAAYPAVSGRFGMSSIEIDVAPGSAPAAAAPATAPPAQASAAPARAFGYGKAPVPGSSAGGYSAAPEAVGGGGGFGYGKAPVPVASAVGVGGAAYGAAAAAVDDGSRFHAVDVQAPEFQELLDADQRQRSKHGRNADIKFVDVDQSQTVGSFDEWRQKYGHVQQAGKGSASASAAKANLSTNEKKKHQITWLAAQAKERQVDLEQHWAQGAAAKNAARQRYGFH